jgi:hypothetical protein
MLKLHVGDDSMYSMKLWFARVRAAITEQPEGRDENSMWHGEYRNVLRYGMNIEAICSTGREGRALPCQSIVYPPDAALWILHEVMFPDAENTPALETKSRLWLRKSFQISLKPMIRKYSKVGS